MEALDDSRNCQTLGVSPAELGAYELLVNQPNVIGVFDKSMDLDEVKTLIRAKVRADYGKN